MQVKCNLLLLATVISGSVLLRVEPAVLLKDLVDKIDAVRILNLLLLHALTFIPELRRLVALVQADTGLVDRSACTQIQRCLFNLVHHFYF